VAVPAIAVIVFLLGLLRNSAGFELLVLTPVRLAVGR